MIKDTSKVTGDSGNNNQIITIDRKKVMVSFAMPLKKSAGKDLLGIRAGFGAVER